MFWKLIAGTIIFFVSLSSVSVFTENLDEIEFNEYIIMPETLLYRIMKGERNFILLDVRPAEEFDQAHIVGALNFPWVDGAFQTHDLDIPVDREIVLISEDGGTALKALRLLLQMNYREVYSVEGGLDNWPYPQYLESSEIGN